MRFIVSIVALALSFGLAHATEIKLDDSWVPRLGQLCDAARYGSRMTAEPICNDLASVVQKAQAEEKAKAPKVDAPKAEKPKP